MKIISALVILMLSNPITAVELYECSYTSESNESGMKTVTEPFRLSFLTDTDSGDSYIVGSQGSFDVARVENLVGGHTYIEITESGNVMTTTITDNLKSVHSRNFLGYSGLVPSQSYGSCSKK